MQQGFYPGDGWIENEQTKIVNWARKILTEENCCILDTETTGIGKDAQAIEIAVVDLNENILFDSLVEPVSSFSIDPESEAIHGIGIAHIEKAPSFSDIYETLKTAIENRHILTYNLKFDTEILNRSCHLAGLPELISRRQSACLMEAYAIWAGQWVDQKKSFKWQPLNGNHRALGDCLAALDCLREIANDA